MALGERQELIRRLQQVRGSKVLSHVTSDRRSLPQLPGMTTQLASEAQPFFAKALRLAGRGLKKLDLFLYTRGGDTNAVWPLVSLIREYCQSFACFIPFRAHSGGTLICLAADEIVMTEQAELSPIDPATGNQFNPVDPVDKRSRLGISVEDVTSYIDLARDKDKVGITGEEHILEVFKELTRKVHPLALGNVHRVQAQIHFLAEKLLSTHKEKLAEDRVPKIIDALVEKFYSHVHAINRREATALLGEGVVKEPTQEEEVALHELFAQYEELLQLNSTFSLNEYIGDRIEADLEILGAVIETEDASFLYETKLKVTKRSELPQNIQVQVQPGRPVIVPGFPTAFNVEVQAQRWIENREV